MTALFCFSQLGKSDLERNWGWHLKGELIYFSACFWALQRTSSDALEPGEASHERGRSDQENVSRMARLIQGLSAEPVNKTSASSKPQDASCYLDYVVPLKGVTPSLVLCRERVTIPTLHPSQGLLLVPLLYFFFKCKLLAGRELFYPFLLCKPC